MAYLGDILYFLFIFCRVQAARGRDVSEGE